MACNKTLLNIETALFLQSNIIKYNVYFTLSLGVNTLVNVYVILPVFTPVAGTSYAYFME